MNILLAVSGSIAAYKAHDVARGLVKNGHKVKVVLTAGALEFIKAETFRYLGVESVHLPQDDFDPKNLSTGSTVLHIELAKWTDKLVVAPLSANTLARLSLGLNNDLLGSLYLALGNKPIVLFPAMNSQMWEQSRVQEHISTMEKIKNISIINPVNGLLACGDIGSGKFPEVSAVIDLIETLDTTKAKTGSVIVTAGATAAPIDPVRYLTNPSSGKMGLAIAKEFLKEGLEVTLFAGHACAKEVDNLKGHPNFRLHLTPTTALMKEAALKYFPKTDLYISTGAIADIEFHVSQEKLKKDAMKGTLDYHQAADILHEILKIKKPHQKVVSFAAETQTTNEVFQEKMQRKPVDLMVGNKVSNGLTSFDTEVIGFQKDFGDYWFIGQKKIDGPFTMKKTEVAEKLVQWFKGIRD